MERYGKKQWLARRGYGSQACTLVQLTTPRTSYFTYYLISTNLTTQVDQLSQPTIVTLTTASA